MDLGRGGLIALPVTIKNNVMKKRPHIILKTAILFTGLLLFSCNMKDDLTYCPKQVRVHFTYNPQEVSIAHVDRMHLYVFNEEGRFISEFRDEQITRFDSGYYIDLPGLYPGAYRIVAWGGKDERDYTTSPAPFEKGVTTFDEALLMLQHPGDAISALIHHLFHADLHITVDMGFARQLFYMPLVQLSNTINISTVGLPASDESYIFTITDNNCTYTFDRSFAKHTHTPFIYSASCSKDGNNQLRATLHVLRLDANRRTPKLEILSQTTTKTLFPADSKQSGDLIELILSAYKQNNFETTHTYDIVLTFTGDDSTGFKVTVTVNGWKVQNQEDDLIE